MVGVVYLTSSKELIPDYAPGVLDPNAVPLPDDEEKLAASEGGGAVSLSYSDKVAVDLKKKKVEFYFQNPSKSTQDIVLQVIVKQGDSEVVIAQSERISAGYALYNLDLKKDAKLKKGGYEGKFNVIFYDEETGEKAVVNTNIPITIAVEEKK
ncbi:MAG: hypothetical protein J6B98_03740 [Bacilli bacterium]|nr:hypothetical protein [Bacilli bacterium]